MNNYLFYGSMVLLLLLNFVLGGNIWTGVFILFASGISQHDARLDCQRQLDSFVEKMEKEYD